MVEGDDRVTRRQVTECCLGVRPGQPVALMGSKLLQEGGNRKRNLRRAEERNTEKGNQWKGDRQ
jgi:hypothetical protein